MFLFINYEDLRKSTIPSTVHMQKNIVETFVKWIFHKRLFTCLYGQKDKFFHLGSIGRFCTHNS